MAGGGSQTFRWVGSPRRAPAGGRRWRGLFDGGPFLVIFSGDGPFFSCVWCKKSVWGGSEEVTRHCWLVRGVVSRGSVTARDGNDDESEMSGMWACLSVG